MNREQKAQAILFFSLLVSTAGTFLLLIQISALVYANTQSALKSSFVFAAQWLVPLVSQGPMIAALKKFRLKPKLISLEVLSAIVSLIIGFGWNFPTLILLLVLRGIFEVALKSSRILAVKIYFDGPALSKNATLTQLGYLLGIASGGLLAALVGTRFSLLEVAAIDASTFVFAGVLCSFLPKPTEVQTSAASGALAVKEVPRSVVELVLKLALVCATFQGIHNVLRVLLPMKFLSLAASGVAFTQLSFIGGVISAATLVAARPKLELWKREAFFVLFAFGSLFLAFEFSKFPYAALGFYFVMAFCFEVLYLNFYNQTLAKATKEQMPQVSGMLGVWPTAVLAATVPLIGFSFDQFSATQVLVTVLGVYGILSYSIQKVRT